MNTVILIGNLTSDPKLSYTANSGIAVSSFRLAVSRPTKDGGADFIPCKVFGRQAETLEQYKKKGDEVAVHGRIETGSYKDKDDRTVYTTEVICDRVEYTRGSKGDAPAHAEDEPSEKKLKPAKPMKEQTRIDWDDLPDSF